jgi:surfactin synthase thioesterase subunit
MGSYIAMDLYRELKLKKLPLPELFICTSSNSFIQEYHYRRERLSKLNDHEFLDKLVLYDMLPKKLLQNPEFLDFFIPAIRADLKLFDEDSYITNLQMECPIFGMYGDRDIVIHPDLKNHWQSFTQKGYSEETFRGGHFFFLEDIPNYTQSLLRKLRNLEK